MTSEFSAASLHSPSGMAGREGLAPMPLLFAGLVFLAAILLRQAVPLNTDVSWLRVVCERMLDGSISMAISSRSTRQWRPSPICRAWRWRAFSASIRGM